MMRPWPGKPERRAAVGAAREEKHRSQATAAKSRELRGQIDRLARANHYAETIEGQIIRGHHQG